MNQERKPCGKYHPLPCGLDKACPVPVDYCAFDEADESQAAWDAYQATQ